MRNYFFTTVLLLALVSCAPASTDNVTVGNAGTLRSSGLACFSLVLPAATEADKPQPQTCDGLCATRDAACAGIALRDGAVLPPLTCDGPASSAVALCRCCRVGP
jgi:hypothetical protein